MKMTGEERIAAPRERVWDALNDPAVLKQCIPGCQSLEKEGDDRLIATVGIRIGPINARLAGKLTIADVDAPNGYTLTGEGQGGAVGFAKGGAKVRLTPEGNGTLLAYDVDAQVGGRLAQLGGAVIDATAKQLAGAFFRKFGEVVSAPPAPTQVGASASAAATASSAPASAPAAATAAPVVTGPAAAPSVPATAAVPAPRGSAVAWFFLAVAATVAGFLIGHAAGGIGDRAALAVELLVLAIAAAGFEVGRRAGGGAR